MADFFGLMADFSIKICDFTNKTLKTQKIIRIRLPKHEQSYRYTLS